MDDGVKLLCSAKESRINNPVDDKKLESRFECPICLSWLQEPLLTSCGHKFCSQCIHKWLKKEGARCPIDNVSLKPENDLFRDLHTSREISQQRVNCPYNLFGCTLQLSPIDIQTHISRCLHKKNTMSETTDDKQHLQNDNVESEIYDPDPKCHQSIDNSGTTEADAEANPLSSDILLKSKNLDLFSKNDAESTDWKKFLKNLFERIVTLEQLNRELTITVQNQQSTISNLQNVIHKTEEQTALKMCHGIYIWKFVSFNERLQEMQSDPIKMFYSPGFYTNPNGYKVCVRVNISSKNRNFLSLVMHIMHSENDDALDWPFNGLISFILIHPTDSTKSICEKTLSRPDLDAFKKPTDDLNRRSFGYTEFVALEDLSEFVKDNMLLFRIEIAPITESSEE